MLIYPHFNPIALQLGPFAIRWYGLMYLCGFLGSWCLLKFRNHYLAFGYTSDQLADIVFYAAIGVILGGRIGYIVFYAFSDFLNYPWLLIQIWKGGMSFHGGLVGVLCALGWHAHRMGREFLALTDFIAPVVPLGLAAGRLGNFINGELWGRVTHVPWGMLFPQAGLAPRHPSQLYEYALEGILLFVILWFFSTKHRPTGAVSGLFLISYGLFRWSVEWLREPDFQIGYVAFGWLTRGQLLSLPMIIIGLGMMTWAYKRKRA